MMTKMVSVRLICLFLLFFFITGRFSVAHHQDGNAARGLIPAVDGEQHWEGILGAAWNKYWGRKAMMIKDIKKLQRMKVKDTSSGTSTSKITSNYSSLEQEKEKDKNVHQSEEVDAQGFVAFNADYRGPRHHPPKNN